jgi:enediyne biosynthesis protein E4
MNKGWFLVCGLIMLSCGGTSSDKDVAARADALTLDQTVSDISPVDIAGDGQVADTPSVPETFRTDDVPFDAGFALYQNHYFKFYRNDGDHFTDITYETNAIVNDAVGAIWSDVDEDGDLDLIVMDRMGAQRNQLFINRVGQDNHWAELDLIGTTANRDAIGARIVVEAGGLKMTRMVKGGGRHMNAQDSHTVHFGLGQAETIDSLTVYWPGGEAEEFPPPPINSRTTTKQSP